jgi:hypothetical protein
MSQENGDVRADKFKELAVRRTRTAIKYIKLVGNLSAPYSYHHTDEQVEQIFGALRAAVDAAEGRFVTPQADEAFNLDSEA